MSDPIRSRLFLVPKPLAKPRVRLVCFPHAGAGASTFQPWAAPLSEAGIEVRSAQYPGRENRWGEPLLRSVPAMAEHWHAEWPQLAGQDGVPVVIYGHSMGVLVAYELACRLHGNTPNLRRLVLGGRNPPHIPSIHPPIHHLENDAFLAAVAERYGNLPAALLADAEMRELIIPVLKADFELVDEYRAPAAAVPLAVPLSLLNGSEDPFVSPATLPDWQRYTAATCRWHQIAGGHFFHQQNREVTVSLIQRELVDIRG
ncbi:MAG: thioesterase II family protein [bacterium]